MDLLHYPNQHQYAITVRHTDLRGLPTQHAHYEDWHKAGQGYPFDTLQNTSLAAGTPIYLTHLSNDGTWGLAITPAAFGWLPMNDIAFVNDEFRSQWQSKPLVTLTQDNVAIKDARNVYHFKASIGSLFPLQQTNQDTFEVAIPVPDKDQQAIIKTVTLSKTQAATFPLPATLDNLATLTNQLMQQPYGWGGLFGYRDCSEMTRDFYSAFGIWLPRQSTSQLKSLNAVDLKKLSRRKRIQYINQTAMPFLTLLGRPGHVMIYIGQTKSGVPIVFHNKWGLHTHYPLVGEGRAVLGKTVISSLMLGSKYYFTEPLIDRTELMAGIQT